MITITINSLSELPSAAPIFLENMKEHRVIAFYGSMGAGKTTFIKALCEYMGAPEIVNSPTFSLINEYNSPVYGKIYHFDFYRINKTEEAYDFGYEEYFYSGHYCFIEWPEKIDSLLPDDCLRVKIEEIDHSSRLITIV
jgi:tRNA threonylcarbamoyladenosine biosynthesis protein TsaE